MGCHPEGGRGCRPRAGLSRDAPQQSVNSFEVTLTDDWYAVRVPSLWDGPPFRLLLGAPRGTASRICSLRP
jgi:hypothetical protein